VRLVYYGTPALAVPALARLVEEGRSPLLVVTRQDRPRGRGLEVTSSPVRAAAESRGLPVATPARAGAPEEIEKLRALNPDLILLAAYGQILSPELLRVPRIGALNLHFSLLPRHRGASPIQAAILAGDEETGVTTMWMTEKLDEGPTFAALRTPVHPEEDAGTLTERLSLLGARCLSETLDRIERGEMVRDIQDSSRATYAPKVRREDARLSLSLDPVAFTRRVRAFAPRPGAYLDLAEGGPLQVLAASPGAPPAGTPAARAGVAIALDRERGLLLRLEKGSVWLRRVRAAGRKEMGGSDYANGARISVGSRLPLLSDGTT
jgi:methionyl-tRNA formyltransferase